MGMSHSNDSARWFYALLSREEEPAGEDEDGFVLIDAVAQEDIDIDALHYRNAFGINRHFPSKEDEGPGLLLLRCEWRDIRERIGQRLAEAPWIRILVSRDGGPNDVQATVVLFDGEGDPPVAWIRKVDAVSPKENFQLREWGMLTYAPRGSPRLISALLDHYTMDCDQVGVAVYDIGQGNCNALVDKNEHPRVFYDLGWPPNFNAKTRPVLRPELFAVSKCAGSPVVLSHWDMDHWAFAVKKSNYNPTSMSSKPVWNEDALSRIWIARAPQTAEHQLGPFHLALFVALSFRQIMPGLSAIQLVPENCNFIDFKHGRIEVCNPSPGAKRDRNNTGLVMWVYGPKNQAILLSGDADFPSIPGLGKQRRRCLVGIVAPHHGGRVTAKSVPRPARGIHAYAILSVGPNNTYGHPKPEAVAEYKAKRWVIRCSSDRQDCDRHGSSHVHGSVVLMFPACHAPRCGCGAVPEGHLCLHAVNVVPRRAQSTIQSGTKPATV